MEVSNTALIRIAIIIHIYYSFLCCHRFCNSRRRPIAIYNGRGSTKILDDDFVILPIKRMEAVTKS